MRQGAAPVTYPHGDHLGSMQVTTGGGNGWQRYSTYGRRRWGDTLLTDRTLTGQVQDATGLVYMKARYYDPLLGQFVSPDTLVPGIVALAQKVRGFAHLHLLLGGGETIFERARVPATFAAAFVGRGRLQLPGVYQNWVTVFDGTFSGGDDYARGTAVHELAHVIDFNATNGNGWLSANVPVVNPQAYNVGPYGRNNGPIEYFAETVAMWVYDTPARNHTNRVLDIMPCNSAPVSRAAGCEQMQTYACSVRPGCATIWRIAPPFAMIGLAISIRRAHRLLTFGFEAAFASSTSDCTKVTLA